MQIPPCPIDEQYRLEALHGLNLLDTAPDPQFESLVRLGQKLFGVETCLVSLVDRDRQWFKARVGLDATETSRDISFCGHAIIQDSVFVVRNALDDDKFCDNPLVVGAPFIRFYAGAPLRLPTGYKIGTLCLISPVPRPNFGSEEIQLLSDLASTAISIIALGALREARDRLIEDHEKYVLLTQTSSAPMAFVKANGEIELCNEAFDRACRADTARGLNLSAVLRLAANWQQEISSAQELRASFQLSPDCMVKLYPFRDGYLVVL